MSLDIKFLSLQKAELSYEVEIRGTTPGATVEELRKQIAKLSQHYPTEDILCSPYTVEKDVEAVECSLDKLHGYVEQLKKKSELTKFKLAQNLANHIYHRLSRIDVSSSQKMLEPLEKSMDRYETLADALLSLNLGKPESQPQSVEITTPVVSQTSSLPQINVTCDRGSSNDFSNLRYSGKTCARAFIQRVDEFIKARGINPSKVLSFATEIFTGEALHWFRCIKDQVTSWDQVCTRLKDDFSLADFDYRFLSEIRARTQGEKENITIYLSIMSGMFSQLSKPLTEQEKLDIILHNIRPSYATVLTSSPDFKDIESLRILCKNFESVQSRLSQFHEPPRVSSHTMAPDYAYAHCSTYAEKSVNPKPGYFHFQHNKASPQPTGSFKPAQGNPRPVNSVREKRRFCPRCRVDTHGLRNCTAERRIVCFRCGRPDVKFHDCPDCQRSFSSPKN